MAAAVAAVAAFQLQTTKHIFFGVFRIVLNSPGMPLTTTTMKKKKKKKESSDAPVEAELARAGDGQRPDEL